MLQGKAKLAALSDAAVFTLPSYSENFGLAVTEAMACGVPVAISNKVNIWREVERYGAGTVSECAPGAFANAVGQILENSNAAIEMGKQGRRAVEELFTWPAVAEQLEAMYAEVIGKHRA